MPKNVRLKGDYSENSAVLYFQKRDYYVFKCCQNHGAVDIITIDSNNKRLELWDVKTQSYIKQISRERSEGVEVLNVESNKGVKIDD